MLTKWWPKGFIGTYAFVECLCPVRREKNGVRVRAADISKLQRGGEGPGGQRAKAREGRREEEPGLTQEISLIGGEGEEGYIKCTYVDVGKVRSAAQMFFLEAMAFFFL